MRGGILFYRTATKKEMRRDVKKKASIYYFDVLYRHDPWRRASTSSTMLNAMVRSLSVLPLMKLGQRDEARYWHQEL